MCSQFGHASVEAPLAPTLFVKEAFIVPASKEGFVGFSEVEVGEVGGEVKDVSVPSIVDVAYAVGDGAPV